MSWGRRVQRQWLLLRARLSGAAEPSGLARQPVHGREILEKVAALPVSTWSYRWEPHVRHLGPMAQDFAATFGLGDDDRTINLIDANGVTLVALQALYRRVITLEAEVETLRALGVESPDRQTQRPPTDKLNPTATTTSSGATTMATKKIEPTNPDKTTTASADGDKTTDRKTNGIRHNGRKSGRKSNGVNGRF